MKYARKALVLFFLFVLLQPARAAGTTYDGRHILLSWSEEAAHSQTVTWHSPSKGEGYVRYYTEGGDSSRAQQVKASITDVGGSGYYRYEAVMKGLCSGTSYVYRIGDGKSWSSPRNFTTAPPRGTGRDFSFVYLGDVQYQNRNTDYARWGKLTEDIRRRNPGIAFGLLGGDMVNWGRKQKDWELFLDNASPVFSRIPAMTAVGNHESTVKADTYLEMMALPENGPKDLEEEFYSFDYGSCHITVLNSCFFDENRKAAMEEEWDSKREKINRWLEKDLQESDAQWKLAVMHHPAYGLSKGDPIYGQIRKNWEPVFESGGIDAVFCGHQHVYMRTREIGGITYIMGNSGQRRSAYYNGENMPDYSRSLDAVSSNYQIVRVTDEKLIIMSYDDEGQLIDKWSKEKRSFPILKAAAAGIFLMHGAGFAVFAAVRMRRRKTCS